MPPRAQPPTSSAARPSSKRRPPNRTANPQSNRPPRRPVAGLEARLAALKLVEAALARRGGMEDAESDAGLAGLEVDHRDHSPAQRLRLGALADRLGLLVTGSSDYHGAGKPNLLGENTTDRAVLDRIEEQGATAVVRP